MKNQNIPACNAVAVRAGRFTAIVLALGAFAFLPQMLALNPPPDGCYPGLTTAEGCFALFSLTSGTGNTALGQDALFSDTTGSFNTGVGAVALGFNNGDFNTAVGAAGLLLNNTGTNNTAMGAGAMANNIDGSNNTAVGASALLNNSGGNYITAIGSGAGTDPDIVTNNVYIGDPGFPGDENVLSIGGIAASGTDFENTYIGGIYGASVSGGLPVYVSADGHLGTSLVNGSTKLRMRTPQLAQPQVKVSEFQKQQKRIAQLEATVDRLVATVKEQAAQIEKVNAKLELRKPAQRVVTNKP